MSPGRRTMKTDGSEVPGSLVAIALATVSLLVFSAAKPAWAAAAPRSADATAASSPGTPGAYSTATTTRLCRSARLSGAGRVGSITGAAGAVRFAVRAWGAVGRTGVVWWTTGGGGAVAGAGLFSTSSLKTSATRTRLTPAPQ